ncbi:MAG: class I SAM-dependent methyltransferase [Betaproteobacteria bacterium]|nr:class I SAM-dependent methyltransferase [Betaproteobacteria bacterium]
MDRSAKFWDSIAERYSKRPIADEAAYQKKLQVTREYFRQDMEVLELGCGTGSTAIAHAPYVKHILAIDISSKMIAIAQGKADAKNIFNITFCHSAIDEFSVPDRSLDAVLGLNVLHLLDNKEEMISRIWTMLKPGGVFVTSTACIGDTILKFLGIVAPLGRFLGLLPLFKVFTTRELEDSFTDAGFDIDYKWQPGKYEAVFIVAKKTE